MSRGAWIFTPEHPAFGDARNRLELRSIRHQIEHQQQAIELPGMPQLSLRWVARSGGTFGPLSSAAANQRQREGRSAPAAPPLDRGATVAWHCYFRCPACDRNALVLVNPLANWRSLGVAEHHIATSWMCQRCCKWPRPSQRWTGTSRRTGRRPPSHAYQRHQHAADRCMELLDEPAFLTWDRWMALERLKNAHLLLATAACCASWPGITSGISPEQIERALRTIERDKWATRQRSWARQGKPRPGPQGRIGQRGQVQ